MAFLATSSVALIEFSIEISFFFLIVVRPFNMRCILNKLLSILDSTVDNRHDVVQQISGLFHLMYLKLYTS